MERNFNTFFFTLVLSILAVLIPFRYCLKKTLVYNHSSLNDHDQTAYKSVVTAFSTDFDKENPLTQNNGLQRMIDLHILHAKNEGADKAVI